MDPESCKAKYSGWFSYHLNHVYYEKKKTESIHRFPWVYCGHCGYAMKRAKYSSTNNQFGLQTRHCLKNHQKAELQRQQFWPVPRPGVYRRGFVPQYFSFVKPVQFSGDTPPPPTITCTEPDQDQQYPESQDGDTILFEETFDYPATPSELSIDEQQDLSDTDVDAMDDFNVREYLESRIDSDPDYNDLLITSPTPVPPEPVTDQQKDNDNQTEDIQTPDIEVEITINQTKPEPEIEATSEVAPEPDSQLQQQEERQDDNTIVENDQQNDKEEDQKDTHVNEEPVEEIQEKNSSDVPPTEKQQAPEEKLQEAHKAKESLQTTPHPDPPKVTFVDSITVTSYKAPTKTADPVKPILKQPKLSPPIQPKPPMDEKPAENTLKKTKPRPMVERREADIRPQVKPGIILKPEPPKEEKKEEQEEKKEEKEKTLTLEEKLPEPEFVEAPGAYRMYQPIDLQQHEQAKAKLKNRINTRASQMPLPTFTATPGHHQMLPESSLVINAVMEDERRKKEGMKPWLQGRLALSKQTSRFELPMDVRTLESMTAMEYLTTYCIISTRRKALFKHIFQKVDKDRDGIIGFRELEKGLKEIHVDSIDVKQVRSIVEMIGADDKTKFNLKQFSAIAALSERVLFSNFVTEETKNINSTKEIIEEADFCSLKWKLDGFKVNPDVRRILEAL